MFFTLMWTLCSSQTADHNSSVSEEMLVGVCHGGKYECLVSESHRRNTCLLIVFLGFTPLLDCDGTKENVVLFSFNFCRGWVCRSHIPYRCIAYGRAIQLQ